MKSTFKVLFYLKKGSEKKNGEVMIMARITIDGKLCQFSTKQSIQPDNWNTAAGKAKGRDAGRINALLDDIRSSLNTIYHEMQRRDNYVTAEKVKNDFLGHSESHETILSLFQKHNDDVKQLVGISKTIATYRKYEVTRRHLAEFIRSKYNVSDISIKEISPMFITDFELYLRTACKCQVHAVLQAHHHHCPQQRHTGGRPVRQLQNPAGESGQGLSDRGRNKNHP